MRVEINIARDFSDAPGGRFRKDGKFSGEEFIHTHLDPKFSEAISEGKLLIDMDGAYGYPVSFLDEAFGRLARKYGGERVKAVLILKCDDAPSLKLEVLSIIDEAVPHKND